MNSHPRPASKTSMLKKRKLIATALVFLAACSMAWADQATESAQKKLKDQGFYYGEITGKKDTDTTAAIRRYQIRNGLQITGELNAETLRALGLTSKPATTPAPPSTRTPPPARTPPATRTTPTEPPGFLEETPAPKVAPTPGPPPPQPDDAEDEPVENAPQPPAPQIQSAGVFDGTPYQAAPPPVQRDIIVNAQTVLLRLGYYRDDIDGVYGPGMNFALRNYQARFGLRPTGRLDVETLASLSLLPEQRTSGSRRYPRRLFPRRFGPGSERIYIPR
jgi:peptidoglycan hydrolase-like protein with peptidoglycan-binding domain